MRRILFIGLIVLLMAAPLPQSSYAGVALGETGGLSLPVLLGIYIVSDIFMYILYWTLVRRLGEPGARRLHRRLPGPARRVVSGWSERAARVGQGPAVFSAIFAAGYASLFAAVFVAGVTRARLVPSLIAAVTADALQFSGTVLAAGLVAHFLPFRGAEWIALLTVPLVAGVLPLGWRVIRRTVRCWLGRAGTATPHTPEPAGDASTAA